jgi:hypothetical protein
VVNVCLVDTQQLTYVIVWYSLVLILVVNILLGAGGGGARPAGFGKLSIGNDSPASWKMS